MVDRSSGGDSRHHPPLTSELHASARLELEEGKEYEIARIATVGRSMDSDIVLTAPSVSRHHARIFYEGGHFWLKDLDSANGTSVNGKRIKLQMLSDRDRIAFGDVVGRFHIPHGSSGPALVAADPLEGTREMPADGTPTGGLVGRFDEGGERLRELGRKLEKAQALEAERLEEIESLRREMASLRRENELLSVELARSKGTLTELLESPGTTGAAGNLEEENERLRKLVRQLERALSDANVRIRNLREHFKRKSD